MKPREKRCVVTSVRWTEDEFCRLQLYLTKTDRDSLSDLNREATHAHLDAELHLYDKNKESNNERKERSKEKEETTKNPLCLADSRISDEANASTNKLKLKPLDERRQAFWNRLVPFVRQGVYPLEMVKAFYLYWTECNENSRKMRFEMEKTYELPRRLATWRRRENKGYGITNSRSYGRQKKGMTRKLSSSLLSSWLIKRGRRRFARSNRLNTNATGKKFDKRLSVMLNTKRGLALNLLIK